MRLEFLSVTESSGAVKKPFRCHPLRPRRATTRISPTYLLICIVSALFFYGNIFCEALSSVLNIDGLAYQREIRSEWRLL